MKKRSARITNKNKTETFISYFQVITKMERKPMYSRVEREGDLVTLIAGDRLPILQDQSRRWMTFEKINHGAKSQLHFDSEISFIEQAENNQAPHHIWRSCVRYLQFDQRGIYLDSIHTSLDIVPAGSQRYSNLQHIVDSIK